MKVIPPFRRHNAAAWLAVVLIAAAFPALMTPPARAASLLYAFTGSGYGHGLGMSQYGAKGDAESGKGYSQIVSRFYQGTATGPHPLPSVVRVGLIQGTPEITVSGSGRIDFVIDGATIASAGANETWIVRPGGSGAYLLFAPDGRQWTLGDPSKWLAVRFEEFGTLLRTAGHTYKYGWLELNTHLVSATYALRSILHVSPFEKYLYGLGEMPSSWHIEALRTQAVAGRTYAVEKMERLGVRSECNCHLYATTKDQAYVGYDKELGSSADRWRSAVDSTAGIVALYNGAPIQAYYSASSGGHTENNENVWGGSPIPYLRGVPDPGDLATSPYINWSVTFRDDELEARLGSNSATAVGALNSIEVLEPRGVSGRIMPVIDADRGGVRITGSAGIKRVSGDTLRSVLGLRSTLFWITPTALEHPAGTFIRGSGPVIYRVVGGMKFPVPTPAVFLSHARWEEYVSVSEAEISSYRPASLGFRDGTLIGDVRNGEVFVVTHGYRRHIPNLETFNALGYDLSKVEWVSPEELALHSRWLAFTDTSRHPDGTFIQVSGNPQVWLLDQGKKRWVPTEAVFTSWSWWDRLIEVSQAEASSYIDGDPLGFRDGTLIGQSSSGKVWVISDGLKRYVSSPSVFIGLGYKGSQIRWVSDDELALHPQGEAVASSTQHPSGAFIKGSGPVIYRVVGGMKFPVPTPAVFLSHARWEEYVSVSEAEISSYRPASLGFSDGTLIGDGRNGEVFVVTHGYRRHIPNLETFNALGYELSKVEWVSPDELALHSRWLAFTDTSHHPDGTFIQVSGNPQVWLLDQGKKRWVPTEAVFTSWSWWDRVIEVSQAEASSYIDGDPLGFRDGTLIGQSSSGKVWVISDGLKRHFVSQQVFFALRYDSSLVRWVSDAELQLNAEGEPIT